MRLRHLWQEWIVRWCVVLLFFPSVPLSVRCSVSVQLHSALPINLIYNWLRCICPSNWITHWPLTTSPGMKMGCGLSTTITKVLIPVLTIIYSIFNESLLKYCIYGNNNLYISMETTINFITQSKISRIFLNLFIHLYSFVFIQQMKQILSNNRSWIYINFCFNYKYFVL